MKLYPIDKSLLISRRIRRKYARDNRWMHAFLFRRTLTETLEHRPLDILKDPRIRYLVRSHLIRKKKRQATGGVD